MAQLINWITSDAKTLYGEVTPGGRIMLKLIHRDPPVIPGRPFTLRSNIGSFPCPVSGYRSLEGAKEAAEVWYKDTLAELGAVPAGPAVPDLDPESLQALVTDVRAAVLRHSSVDYQVHKRRVHAALVYMDGVISPSQITLENVKRILKGE